MDGENNASKPYFWMDDLGVPLFLEGHPYVIMLSPATQPWFWVTVGFFQISLAFVQIYQILGLTTEAKNSPFSRPVAGLKIEKPCIGGRMKDLFHKDGATSKAAKVNIAWQSKDVTSGPFSKKKRLYQIAPPKKWFNAQMRRMYGIFTYI